MLHFKVEFLRRVIKEAVGPMYMVGLEIKGERRFFIHRCASTGLQYHLTHNGRYINFPRREYAQDLVDALQSYVRAHYYEWQALPTVYVDITKCEREVIARHLVWRTDAGLYVSTGLAYFKTGDGSDDFYSPLHLASQEQLLGLGWRNELTIQSFLQLLSSSAPSPEYWHNTDRVACIKQFPGGYPAIIDLGDKASTK